MCESEAGKVGKGCFHSRQLTREGLKACGGQMNNGLTFISSALKYGRTRISKYFLDL